MRRYKGVLAALVPSLGIAVADADAQAIQLDELAVTARGYEAPLSETPGSIAVVTAEDIALSKKDSVADVLADIPGVTVSGDSPWGRDVSIRGMSGTSVVILIDGKRINTATDMNARLGLINPADVERIEVLKGPVSALYGSGSTGGVINIITRKGRFSDKPEVHGRTDLSATTNAAGGDAYGNVQYDDTDVWLLASGAFRGHTDYRDGGGDRADNSAYRDGQVRMAGGFRPTEALTIELSALRTEARDVGIPGGPSTLAASSRVMYPRTTSTLVSADATLDVGADVLKEISGSVYYNLIERRVYIDDINATVDNMQPAADHATFGGNLRTRSEFGDHTVVAGAEGWSWTMESLRRQYRFSGAVVTDQPTPDARQTSLGLYAEDTYALTPAWSLNFGGRLDRLHTHNAEIVNFPEDDDDDLGWNVHAGATWKMGGPWSQNLLVGSSYRAADLLERFKYIALGGGSYLYGNPDLDPEQTVFAEWGLDYATREFQAGVRLFGNEIHNYITQKQTSGTRWDMVNVGKARILGVEMNGQWNFAPKWNLHGDVSAVDGRDRSADEPLSTIAPVSGKVGIGYRDDDGWFVKLDERWAAPQTRTPEDVDHVGGYATTHVATGYDFDVGSTTHRVALSLDNLFDARYRNYLANTRNGKVDQIEPGFAATLTYSMEF